LLETSILLRFVASPVGFATFRTFVSGLRVSLNDDRLPVVRLDGIFNLEVALIVVGPYSATG
jgi:hypothetical protein